MEKEWMNRGKGVEEWRRRETESGVEEERRRRGGRGVEAEILKRRKRMRMRRSHM